MSLLTQIDQDLATSMKAGSADRTAVIRLIKSSFSNEQIKLGRALTEGEAAKVVAREAKQRRDSISQYQAANRQDLADKEQAELEIIGTYLPEQMSEAELTEIVNTVITEIGASGPAQMGQVIGAVMQKVGGSADGATVSKVVRARLQ